MNTTTRTNAKRNRVTSLRWSTVAYSNGSGLQIGVGQGRVYPNALCIDDHGVAGANQIMRLDRPLIFVDGTFDFVLLAEAIRRVPEPKALLAEAWRVLRQGGFLILAQPTPVAFEWIAQAAKDHALTETLIMGAYRIDVICKLPAGQGRLDARLPVAEKTCAVIRPGGFGDAIWASSILPHLKAEGYQITVYVDPQGEQVLRHDPYIDALIVTGDQITPNAELGAFYMHEEQRYDRWINLVESVEKNMIAVPNDLRFFWRDAERRRIFGGSYIEAVHDRAGVPHDFRQKFYPTPEERAQAEARKARGRRTAVIAASGSTLPKWWPHVGALADQLIGRGYDVWVLGELRALQFAPRPHLHVIGISWSLRESLTFAQHADLVVGQDTGLLNAVALEHMPKVVLLSIASAENLTKHWRNTRSLSGDVPCFPCHRLHYVEAGWHHCNHDAATDAAACQAAISVEQVLAAIDELRPARAA
jgi:ADP-heptose:LPS heptosyltransferase